MPEAPSQEHFDRQYERRAFFAPNDVAFVIYDPETWRQTKEWARRAARIADFGAGGGTLLGNIAKETDAELVAVEFSQSAQELLRARVPGATVLGEDVAHTSLETDSIDLVVSAMTIEHVEEAPFLKEVRRVLRDNGHFLVTTVMRSPRAWYFYRDGNGRPVLEPTHRREYASSEEFLKILDASGFRALSVRTPRIRYPLVDPLIKLCFGHGRGGAWRRWPATRAGEGLRKLLRVPIPGYRAIEALCIKKT
ncbi:MAG: methyltransferase domain-containing protein [Deltaproteobacteria bacterium]